VEHSSGRQSPPEWSPAPERSYDHGLRNDAPEDEFKAAEAWCQKYPVDRPRLLSSDTVERINSMGCRAWGLELPSSSRFSGRIENDVKGGPAVVRVQTTQQCQDVSILSDLPLMAGLYDIQGKSGVYYEILIHQMYGFIAIGTSCRPYPSWRLPGWNRLSAGLHLDDCRKFFEDVDGGRDYVPGLDGRIRPGDTIGCGYVFATGELFFTHNGQRLPPAFTGIYLPRPHHDVYAAIGVEGQCVFEVNFGGEYFKWKEGNEWAWRVEGHVGRLNGSSSGGAGGLPSYDEARGLAMLVR